ncbi:bifunctional hydroxymethylpyrimidine kinase/phosphomethylpyrimidine kinase [Desulfurobacterium atlanticum]|uniref:Hydroxymethylpyrimidine/phosphomethylpyrimidine kinase n=1 Tax=Desulfurobacterium atlanticum TaxID=240169 RepID=A0A239A770_9BACT|nr:bifunctional hydroxymethylpyrimidine kinase/phosphomethylpyrimidine kinase [Desulfurobacterium atlanticum]SNR91349.1 hydroxymethylpyrimidine/phosphomethylpyrimidine kinase [Desulfurobacterium atlanticum]
MVKKPTALLSIAGFDPTGGAGIIRDILTFKHFGYYGISVITANTSQNTKGVKSIIFEPCEIIKEQLTLLFEEFEIKGVKIGLPHKDYNFNVWLANFLKDKQIPIVFDPVIKPTAGRSFVENLNTITPLIETSTVITPNESEFNLLKNCIDTSKIPWTIIKGKKEKNSVSDLLLKSGKTIDRITHEKDTLEIHGTGCAFSSALLALMIKEKKTEIAFRKAVEFLSNFRKQATEGLKQRIYTE